MKTAYEVKYWAGVTLGVFATEAEAQKASADAYRAAVEGGSKWAAQNGTPQTVIVRYARGWRTVIGGHGTGFSRSKSRRASAPALTT